MCKLARRQHPPARSRMRFGALFLPQLESHLHSITVPPCKSRSAQLRCCVAHWLQLEAHLHPITRTVLRIALNITPAFNWKDRWVGGGWGEGSMIAQLQDIIGKLACKHRGWASHPPSARWTGWHCVRVVGVLLPLFGRPVHWPWLLLLALLTLTRQPWLRPSPALCFPVHRFQSRQLPRHCPCRSVHGNALKWLVWVEDSANEHIYHSGACCASHVVCTGAGQHSFKQARTLPSQRRASSQAPALDPSCSPALVLAPSHHCFHPPLPSNQRRGSSRTPALALSHSRALALKLPRHWSHCSHACVHPNQRRGY